MKKRGNELSQSANDWPSGFNFLKHYTYVTRKSQSTKVRSLNKEILLDYPKDQTNHFVCKWWAKDRTCLGVERDCQWRSDGILRNAWKLWCIFSWHKPTYILPETNIAPEKWCFLNFHPENWGNDPFWRADFSDGLKPPTSQPLDLSRHWWPLKILPSEGVLILSPYHPCMQRLHLPTIWLFFLGNVGKYTSPMDVMGSLGLFLHAHWINRININFDDWQNPTWLGSFNKKQSVPFVPTNWWRGLGKRIYLTS